MANLETQAIDDLMVKGRRKMLTLGGTALAGLMFSGATNKAQAASTFTDNDILNFALNLEYLEANYYYLAAFGTTIDQPNAASIAASMATGGTGAAIPITVSGSTAVNNTAGTVNKTGAQKVPFSTVQVGSYAVETAIEEGKHVLILQKALGTLAVNQPAINLSTAIWQALAGAANVAGAASFSPYASDAAFLVGAYVFEDVGVTAYHGAASLLTGTTTTLPVAAGILAVEAYHAGLVRTTINYLDPVNASGYLTITNQISFLRNALAKSAATASGYTSPFDGTPDDFGLQGNGAATTNAGVAPTNTVMLAGTAAVATRITDADPTNVIAISRNTTQVLNIVTGGGAVSANGAVVSPATGIFFTAGLNGLFR